MTVARCYRLGGLVLDHHGIWRDQHGRIAAEPEVSQYSREHQYTWHDNGHERIAYAMADSRRLERLNDGDWAMLCVFAVVEFDGVEIGRDCIGGVESDGGERYIREMVRQCAHEALHQARAWRARNLVQAAS